MKVSAEDYAQLLQKFEELTQKVNEIEARQEISELYFEAVQMRQKSIEEIIEDACLNYFDVNQRDFRDATLVNKFFKKGGRPRQDEVYKKSIIQAQQWFMSIMVNVLHKTTYSMKSNYSFYNQFKVAQHRPIFLSALGSVHKTEADKKNAKILMSLFRDIRTKMKQEKVVNENFD